MISWLYSGVQLLLIRLWICLKRFKHVKEERVFTIFRLNESICMHMIS